MPIEFAQPEPFAPSINSAYGAAQEYDQFAPLLQQGQAAMNSQLGQQAQTALQGGLAAAQMRLAASGQTAQLQSENQNQAMHAATALQQSRDANANDQYLAQVHSVDQQNALQFEGQQQQQNAAQAAQLQAWLSNQEMTQADQMRLQRQQNAVSEIQNEPGLSDDERRQMILTLKTGIDVGQQRLQATHQKQMEQQTQLEAQRLQTATSHELAARSLAAKTLPERSQTVYDQALMGQHLADVTAEFDAAHPGWASSPVLSTFRNSAIQQEAQSRVADDGGAVQYIETEPGKFTEIKPKNHPENTAKLQTIYDKQHQDAEKHYDVMFQAALKRVDEKYKNADVPPTREQVMDDARKDLEARGIKKPVRQVVAEAPKRAKWAGNAALRQPTPAAGGPPAPGQPGQPAPEPAKVPDKPVNVEKPSTWTPYDRTQMTNLERGVQEVMARTDLPGQMRKEYVDAIEKARNIFTSGEAAKKQDEIKKIMEFLATMPAPPQAPQPPAPPPQVRPSARQPQQPFAPNLLSS